MKTALVTGANRGIGLAIANALQARSGVRVLAACRNAEIAAEAASIIGEGTIGVVVDLSDPITASAQTRAIDQEHGGIDILINNAGVLLEGDGLSTDIDAVNQSLAVNTVSPTALVQAVAPGMIERDFGRIVNVSSGWGSFNEGLEGPFAYSVSKAALNAVTFCLAATLPTSVKINAACPGWVRTRMGGKAATRSTEEGADTPVWLATLPDDGPTGGLFRDRQRVQW